MHIAAYLHERNEVKKQVNLFALEKQLSLLGWIERGKLDTLYCQREREREGAGGKGVVKTSQSDTKKP